MARLARVVIPGVPHHVTQRGNGRARTFFSANDYALYLTLLAQHCAAANAHNGETDSKRAEGSRVRLKKRQE